MSIITVTGTTGVADTSYLNPQIWSGSQIIGYQDYEIVDFELGADELFIPFNGGQAGFSTVADFQSAMLDIEATGNLGWSSIGTSYEIVGNDVVFSWDGQGNITLKGLAADLDLGPSSFSFTSAPGQQYASDRHDTIDITGGGGTVVETGYGDDVVTVGNTSGWWVSVSNLGGNDDVTLGDGGDFYWGANDSNGTDLVRGEGGNDQITTYAGNDTIFGGDGEDTISDGDGNDFIYGEAGGAIMYGASDGDTFYNGSGDDYTDIGTGRNHYHAGSGNDLVIDHSTGEAPNDGDVFHFDFTNLVGSGNNLTTIRGMTIEDGTHASWDELNFVFGEHDRFLFEGLHEVSALNSRADTTAIYDAVVGTLTITNDNFGTVLIEEFVVV